MIKTPIFTLLYNNKSATHDIAEDLLEATFTDNLTGEADELDITLADEQRKWMGDWYPEKGAKLRFAIGFLGEKLLDCGEFEIDEITISDSPNTVQIRALSASVSSGLRTNKYKAYDNYTLDKVIQHTAKSLGYQVEGKIQPLPIERITQKETDLAFIKRLADSYGYIVKVIGTRLIFSQLSALKATASIATIDRKSMYASWYLRDQIRTVKKDANVTKQNPSQKKTVKASVAPQRPSNPSAKTAKAKIAHTKQEPKDLMVFGIKDGQVKKVN
ncbi:phage late control D family protein [Acinetobacter sp. c3-l95]|uniref:phage late control D family protein n=1 Tax=Acinetobacter sp. c3-l95 TaxID=3342804 RepID=UPI0035B6D225